MTGNTGAMKDEDVVPLEELMTEGEPSTPVGGWWPYLQQRPPRHTPDETAAHYGHEGEG